MALWTVHGDGRRPVDDAVVGSEERLSWPRTLGFGVQHLVTMFGATMLVPMLTGLPPMTTLLLSGVSTLVFLMVTRNRVPSYLGACFAFVVPLSTAADKVGAGPAALLGAVVVVGLVVVAVGVAVKALGVRLLEAAMPPIVTGAVVLMLGLSLAPKATSSFQEQPVAAALTASTVLLATVLSRGPMSRVSVLVGILLGWAYSAVAGELDPARVAAVKAAPWLSVPEMIAPRVHLSVVPFVLPLAIVLVAEHVGHVKAVSAMTGRDLDGSVGDALIGGGLATTLAGSSGGAALSSYAPNMGVMAATRVYSTAACASAAVLAILLAFSPKLGAVFATIPLGVFGGAVMVLFGMLALIGARIWLNAAVDFADPVNLAVIGTALIAGVGQLTLSLGDLRITGVVWGSVLIVICYPILRRVVDVRARRATS